MNLTHGFRRRSIFGLTVGLTTGAIARPAYATTRGGKLIFGRVIDANYLDPVMTQVNAEIWLMQNIFDNLTESGADGRSVQPSLAAAWDFSPDALTPTFALRDGLRFSDGSPLTAEDVKFTLDRSRDPKIGLWGNMLAAVETIETPDARHVVLKLKNPAPALLPVLAMFSTCILPKQLIMAAPGGNVEEKVKAFMARPVGSGPFVLVEIGSPTR